MNVLNLKNMLKNLPLNQLLQQMPQVVPNFCDKCGARHSKEDIEVLGMGHEQDRISLRLTCENCKSIYMIQVQSPSEGVLAARKTITRSDISTGETMKFGEAEDIHVDEILDVVLALKHVSTISDFDHLF